MTQLMLEGRRVVVGVCGGIAAYKACEVISRLRQAGAEVRVVATRNATEFVGLAALRALSGQDVAREMFGQSPATEIEHISLAEFGEALVVVSATANVIGKVAAGICDDLLTTTVNAAAGRVIFAPAMNWRMWENPITRRNVATLEELGYWFVGPECGHLACGETGMGRLADTGFILDSVDQALGPPESKLRGQRVLITSGPTLEFLDPVRFISNPSSGKMGFALAREALARGALVRVITGPTSEAPPWGATVFPVLTTQEMLTAALTLVGPARVVIGAAAPTDFRSAAPAEQKIKKQGQGLTLELVETPDVLAALQEGKAGRIHVGFAAETEDLEANARGKLERKGLDLIVANDVTAPGVGFGSDTNAVTIYRSDGGAAPVGMRSKRQVAAAILDEVEKLMG